MGRYRDLYIALFVRVVQADIKNRWEDVHYQHPTKEEKIRRGEEDGGGREGGGIYPPVEPVYPKTVVICGMRTAQTYEKTPMIAADAINRHVGTC